jgi:hypothetical protein
MEISKYFDKNGSCPSLGDPYREQTETAKLIFDEDGDVRYNVYFDLVTFCQNNPVKPFSDAVRIVMAQEMGGNTKGSYPAIYMWR